MKTFTNLIFATAIALQPTIVWAEAQLYVPPPAPPPAPVQYTNPNAPNYGGPAPNATINQGSNVGQASQQGGAGANNAAGAALIAAGVPLLAQPPTVPIGAMLIAMGIMALAQGSHDSGAAGQSADTGAHSVYNNGNPDTQAGNEATTTPGANAFDTPEIKKQNAKLAKYGYEVGPKGVKMPDGSVLPASAFSSKSAMAAAGIDPAVLAKLDDVNKNLASQYSVSSMPVATGGGGGGSGGAGGSAEDVGGGESGSGSGRNPFSMDSDAKRAMMAGKTVSLDGDPIGVAGMNIFDMIHSAYQKKRTGSQFLEDEAGGEPMLRAPASVRPSRKRTR